MTTQKILEGMVFEGVLHDQATARWCPAAGELFLTPDTSELIVFVVILFADLGFLCILSCGNFLVTTALACAISIPTVFFISPSSLICVKHSSKSLRTSTSFAISSASNPSLDMGPPKVVGGVYLQLRDGMVKEYIQVPLNTSLKGWNVKWFYI